MIEKEPFLYLNDFNKMFNLFTLFELYYVLNFNFDITNFELKS